MFPSTVHQVVASTSDSCSDCPEESVSASPRPPSVTPSSSESPSCPSSPSPSTTTQEIVTATSTAVLHTPSVTAADTGSVSSPTTSTVTSGRFSPVNPLVAAGLVPENLSDILITPPDDAAVTKQRTKRIVGAGI